MWSVKVVKMLLEQIVALKLEKSMGQSAFLLRGANGHKDSLIVITDPPGDSLEKLKRTTMGFLEDFRADALENLHKHCIRERKAHYKKYNLTKPVVLFYKSIAKIYLGFTGTMNQRYENFLVLTLDLSYRFLDLCLSTGIAFRSQSVKITPGRMTLLAGKMLVVFYYLTNPLQLRTYFGLGTPNLQTVAR